MRASLKLDDVSVLLSGVRAVCSGWTRTRPRDVMSASVQCSVSSIGRPEVFGLLCPFACMRSRPRESTPYTSSSEHPSNDADGPREDRHLYSQSLFLSEHDIEDPSPLSLTSIVVQQIARVSPPIETLPGR